VEYEVRVSTYSEAYASAVVLYATGLLLDLMEYRDEQEFKRLKLLFEKDRK